MIAFIFQVLSVVLLFSNVYGSYDCLCNYRVETSVYEKDDVNSPVLGYLYEFDCKPTMPISISGWQVIEYEHRVGYVKQDDDQLQIQICSGVKPLSDRVTTPKPIHTTPKEPHTTKNPSTPDHVPATNTSGHNSSIISILPSTQHYTSPSSHILTSLSLTSSFKPSVSTSSKSSHLIDITSPSIGSSLQTVLININTDTTTYNPTVSSSEFYPTRSLFETSTMYPLNPSTPSDSSIRLNIKTESSYPSAATSASIQPPYSSIVSSSTNSLNPETSLIYPSISTPQTVTTTPLNPTTTIYPSSLDFQTASLHPSNPETIYIDPSPSNVQTISTYLSHPGTPTMYNSGSAFQSSFSNPSNIETTSQYHSSSKLATVPYFSSAQATFSAATSTSTIRATSTFSSSSVTSSMQPSSLSPQQFSFSSQSNEATLSIQPTNTYTSNVSPYSIQSKSSPIFQTAYSSTHFSKTSSIHSSSITFQSTSTFPDISSSLINPSPSVVQTTPNVSTSAIHPSSSLFRTSSLNSVSSFIHPGSFTFPTAFTYLSNETSPSVHPESSGVQTFIYPSNYAYTSATLINTSEQTTGVTYPASMASFSVPNYSSQFHESSFYPSNTVVGSIYVSSTPTSLSTTTVTPAILSPTPAQIGSSYGFTSESTSLPSYIHTDSIFQPPSLHTSTEATTTTPYMSLSASQTTSNLPSYSQATSLLPSYSTLQIDSTKEFTKELTTTTYSSLSAQHTSNTIATIASAASPLPSFTPVDPDYSMTSTSSLPIAATSTPAFTTSAPVHDRVDLCPYQYLADDDMDYSHFRQYGDFCYEIRQGLTDWTTSRADCFDRGGHLAVVDNVEIEKRVKDLIATLQHGRDAWIGLHVITTRVGRKYIWVNGTFLPSSVVTDKGLDPATNNFGKDCVVMDDTSAWTNIDCNGASETHSWVCQYSIT